MTDAIDNIVNGVAGEGVVFDFLLFSRTGCTRRVGGLRGQVDTLKIDPRKAQDRFDVIIVLCNKFQW